MRVLYFFLLELKFFSQQGIAHGVIDAAEYLVEHPAETALCLVASEYVLAYQLSKMLFELAQIGVISYLDPEKGRERWDEYIEPINQTIAAIASKEINLRDCVKGAARFATSCATQRKLLRHAGSFYQKAKNKALAYATANPLATPAHYMKTPEGGFIKNVRKSCFANFDKKADILYYKQGKNINSGINKDVASITKTQKIEWTPHGYKHFPQKNLTWKEIVEYTKHGDAKYKKEINIENLERFAWEMGTKVKPKNWKIMAFDYIIGANSGLETTCMRVEMSANTIHGHPITLGEYKTLLK